MQTRNLPSEVSTQMGYSFINTVAFASRTIIACAVLLCVALLNVQPVSADDTATSSPLPSSESAPTSCPNVGGTGCATDAGSATSGNLPDHDLGNPINLMTGNKHQNEVDFEIPGAALSLRRMYNSGDSDSNRGLGQGWSHSYTVSLLNAGNGNLQIAQSDGGRINFYPDGTDANGYPLLRAIQSNHGYVIYDNERYYWHVGDGRTLTFNGQFLVHIDWPDQRELKLYYRQKRLSTVTDETGRVLSFAYTGGSRAEALPSFDESRFGTAEGYLERVTLPDNSVIAYDYDNKRNLTRVRFPDGTNREYHYENEVWPNHLTGLTDRTGVRFASWTYDDEGRAHSSEHADGVEKVSLVFPDLKAVADGQIVKTDITNSLGHISTYTWQQENIATIPRLLSSEGAGCATCPATGYEFTYDEQGRLLSSTNTGLGNAVGAGSVLYEYDEQGRIGEKRRVDSEGIEHVVEKREYRDGSLMPSRILEPSVRPNEQRVRSFEYDNAQRPISITESGWSPIVEDESRLSGNTAAINSVEHWQAVERTIAYEYDDQGRLISVDAPRDDVEDILRIEWDDNNRPVAIQTPDSPPITNSGFNSLGQVTSFSIGNQSAVTIKYNAQNLPEQITQFGRTLSFNYDAESRVTSYTGPDGDRTQLEYDDAGDVVKIIKPDGSTTRFDHDSEGQRVSNEQFNRDGTMIKSVSTLFDALGRLESSSTNTLNAQGNLNTEALQNTHDNNGQRVAVTNTATGDEVRMQYNALGKLAGFDEPGSLLDNDAEGEPNAVRVGTGFEYDSAGNEIALTDARSNRTLYLKDDFGNVVVHHSPDTGTTRYQYDAAGNRSQKTNADGDVTTYQWDAASRMIKKQREDGLYTYAYDEVHGLLSESVAPATTERFAYDERARLISHERIIDDQQFVTGYRFDENGRVSHKFLPDGQTLRYHYEDTPGHTRGNLVAITRESLFGLRQENLIEQIDQDTGDGSGGYVASNGLRTTHHYAPDGSITAIDIDQVMSVVYEFDDAGRITGIDMNGTAERYNYSRQGLSIAETEGSTYRYEYDGVGNRSVSSIEKSDGTVAATRYDYPEPGEGNRLLNETTLSGELAINELPLQQQESRRYNQSGAPVIANGYRYEYNTAQRPVKVFENGELLAEYAYNGFGERIKKVVYRGDLKKITYYLYDGQTLTAEIDADTSTYKQAVFLDSTPVAYLVGQDTYAIHSDHLGTPRMVTDKDGEIAWTADYDPFGKATIKTNATLDLPYRLPGQYADSETGTHYNYFRDYDPATGRYITSDPIGLQGGLNTYAYALNDPLGLTDRLGLNTGPGPPTTTGDSPTKPTVGDTSEQAYADKLKKVLDYAIASMDAGSAAEKFLKDLAASIPVLAVIVSAVAIAHATGVGFVADAVLGAAGYLIAGYAAGKFLFDTIKLMITLDSTDLCDEPALKKMGEDFAKSIGSLAQALADSLLLGGLKKIGDALKDLGTYAKDGAFTLLRKLRARFRKDTTLARVCSFAGDTLVVTQNGRKPIRDIKASVDRVLAKDELSGRLGWRDVLAQYSNQYAETVHVTTSDGNGTRQTISSNRIHPYFARVAASALIATASIVANPVMATEGHVYAGDIAGGAWVDAQYLQPGDQLLGENNQWQTVEALVVQDVPLDAYNLSVDEYATYFVAGDEDATAVWVHNKCFDDLPNTYVLQNKPNNFGQPKYLDKDGNELYMGHDGRYYDPTVKGQEPTAPPKGVKPQSLDDLLVNGDIPGNTVDFQRWFDNLTPAQFDRLWVGGYRDKIESLIRKPGELHEWCMVCRAPQFKRWGVPMSEIHRFRTNTGDLKWIIPPGRANAGKPGGHTGDKTGSTTFHNELIRITDSSTSLAEFNRRLRVLADTWKITPGLPELIQ